ncbi:hypothetical protein DFH07DRAFT_976537 [Mycena maculata]|uniref:Uncharacterized protein n=1 Tax=Mycena maculata TaxID=230809 RepID=A0AAD7K809_9AGAR|nr:hypothetical protein DFH07DRAFT_976537 [Mycena maculata]
MRDPVGWRQNVEIPARYRRARSRTSGLCGHGFKRAGWTRRSVPRRAVALRRRRPPNKATTVDDKFRNARRRVHAGPGHARLRRRLYEPDCTQTTALSERPSDSRVRWSLYSPCRARAARIPSNWECSSLGMRGAVEMYLFYPAAGSRRAESIERTLGPIPYSFDFHSAGAVASRPAWGLCRPAVGSASDGAASPARAACTPSRRNLQSGWCRIIPVPALRILGNVHRKDWAAVGQNFTGRFHLAARSSVDTELPELF